MKTRKARLQGGPLDGQERDVAEDPTEPLGWPRSMKWDGHTYELGFVAEGERVSLQYEYVGST